MQKQFSVDIEAGQAFDRAALFGHRDVPHALPSLGGKPIRDQFVVAPDGAVKEQERRSCEAGPQLVGDMGAGGNEIEMLVCRLVADTKPERVAFAVAALWVGRLPQIPGRLAWYREGQDFDPARRAVGQFGLEGPVDL